jgi:hypothetical protein
MSGRVRIIPEFYHGRSSRLDSDRDGVRGALKGAAARLKFGLVKIPGERDDGAGEAGETAGANTVARKGRYLAAAKREYQAGQKHGSQSDSKHGPSCSDGSI